MMESKGNPETEVMEMDTETEGILKKLMTHEFQKRVDPENVLSLLTSMSVNTNVLTEIDFSVIKATRLSRGPIVASGLLLDCMCKYKNWFVVIQQVLRHRDVRLSSLADDFDKMKGEAFQKRLELTVVHQHGQLNPGSNCNADSTSNTAKLVHHSISASSITSKDDFDLDDDNVIAQGPKYVMDNTASLDSDMPRPKQNPESSPAAKLTRTSSSNPKEDDERKVGQANEEITDEEGYTQVQESDATDADRPKSPSEEEDECYENLESVYQASQSSSSQSGEAGLQYENPSVSSVELKPHHRKSKGHSDKRREKYNFTYDETAEGLSGFDGWHTHQRDKTVLKTFRGILEEKLDGHYMIWYWEKRKRPSICVSHKGDLVTFVIHRRPNKESPTQNMFYINKLKWHPTLKDLFQHHLDNGLPDMRERGSSPVEHIKMLYPIDPVTGPKLDL